MKKGSKVPCTPVNTNLTLATSGKMLNSVKNDSISSLSLEKKGKKK